jgi:ribose 5-phosphate isomerase A
MTHLFNASHYSQEPFMTQDELKHRVAKFALDYVEENSVIGVGSGSTAHFFIDYLATIKYRIEGAVASSNETEARLKAKGIPVFNLNAVPSLSVYIDGADAFTRDRLLVKGGGGALTREKILASASSRFICMVDETKQVNVLGEFPIAIEVIPMARSFIGREIVKLGGSPVYRQNFITNNGNIILDVYNWIIAEPIKLEKQLNNLPGVVSNGIFADHPADVLLISASTGISVLEDK